VFVYHEAFIRYGRSRRPEVAYRAGKVGHVEVKTELAAALEPAPGSDRERRAAVLAKAGSPAGRSWSKARSAPRRRPTNHDARPRRDEDVVRIELTQIFQHKGDKGHQERAMWFAFVSFVSLVLNQPCKKAR